MTDFRTVDPEPKLQLCPIKVTDEAKMSCQTEDQQSCRAAAEGDTNALILDHISQVN